MSTFVHRLVDGAAFDALRLDVATHGAVLLPLAGDPPLQTEVGLSFVTGDDEQVASVRGLVVQVQPDGRAVIVLDDENQEAVLDAVFPGVRDAIAAVLEEAEDVDDLRALLDDDDDDDGDDDDEDEDDDEDNDGEDSDGDDEGGPEEAGGDDDAPPTLAAGQVPLWAQYAAMHKRDKLKLAKFGNVDARRMVLKDRDQSLHIHVLANPGMTAKELSAVIRNKQASAALLKRVLERTDFMSNLSVVEALVFNPHTPLREAVKLVPKVSMDAARRITKTQSLREPIVRAARRRVHAKARR